ncbi:murein hydrolase activator NlpD [Orbaceae bacterium ESL0727]|nr:murein hydrolase activator NlpD [Orbaceae bacterium ESL0727]
MKKILTLSCLGMMIVACTQNDPAEIKDVSDSSSSSDSSIPSGYSKPPANISTGRRISSPPPSQPATYSQPTSYAPATRSQPTTYASSAPASTVSSHTTSSSAVRGSAMNSSATNSSAASNESDANGTSERITYNRNYESIPKGGYQGDSYTVKRGDTLYYIAWVTGNDVRSLASKNNLKEPYSVNVGQVLDVSGGTASSSSTSTKSTETPAPTTTAATSPVVSSPVAAPVPTPTAQPTKPKSVMTTTTTTTTTMSSKTQPPKTTQTTQTVTQPIADVANSDNSVSSPVINSTPIRSESTTTAKSSVANISWQWPAKGKLIEKFSSASKGIDIAGSLGDKVVAAAAGRVVYSGNALPGYGNLIIIKHNDDYLTAYAHNQSILVKEQQSVRAGEQIASMGATGTSSVRLHFEIRYKAQSVDPLKYLPN